MQKRIVNETVVVIREIDGGAKRVTPPIGKAFPFTPEEIASIEASSETALSKVTKDGSVVEDADEDDATVEETGVSAAAAAKAAKAAKSAKDTEDL